METKYPEFQHLIKLLGEDLCKNTDDLHSRCSPETLKYLGQKLLTAAELLKESWEKIDILEFRDQQYQDLYNKDYWIWQGDGDDHIESLTCPVVISPRTLQELIDNQKKVIDWDNISVTVEPVAGYAEAMEEAAANKFDEAMKDV